MGKSWIPLALLALECAGCGSYPLAGNIVAPDNRNAEQQQTDVLVCKDQAKTEANTTGRQTGAFLLGMTIVGAPVAFEMEKSKQREVFADCMTAKGYTVAPSADSMPRGSASAAATPSMPPIKSKVGIKFPAGWAEVKIAVISPEIILQGLNRTIDAGALLGTARREGITNTLAYATTKRADQINRLTDPSPSNIVQVDVNGKKAYRYTVSGSIKTGIKVTYLTTVVEGLSEIVTLNTWTGSSNFESRRPALEALSTDLTGL
jgi:hypothetical protein